MPPESPREKLAQTIADFLAASPDAVVLEDGLVIFDLSSAKASLSTESNKCLLHLWSGERNIVRRVESAEHKNGRLRLDVRKFGQAKSTKIELCADRDLRTPSARRAGRAAFQRFFSAVLQSEFPGRKIERLTSASDLEHSLGPAYARCIVRKGRLAFATIGVSEQETQSTIDNVLAAGLLWLDLCRADTARALVEGLRLFLPAGCADIVRVRMAKLNHRASHFHLYEVSEGDGTIRELDIHDAGNIVTRLVRCPDEAAVRERFADAIAQVQKLSGEPDEIEFSVISATELAFRRHGLEFARVRNVLAPGSFAAKQQITFGAGAYETQLTDVSAPHLRELVLRMMRARRGSGDRGDALFRMQPERWLESIILREIQCIDARLDPTCVYRQVPAFAASDRAMIDLLACTREGRLAVIELKASEDMHLPLQGLDYWARVEWHHQRREFQQFGYFPGRVLSPEPPLLFLVSPVLQVHPATDAQLKYFSSRIEWTLVGVNEDWRDGVRVIFRKSRKD